MMVRLMLIGLVAFMIGCTSNDPGPITSQFRPLESFDKILINTVGNTHLIESNEFKIEIISNTEILRFIETEVENDQLVINLLGNHKKIDRIEFYIHAPSFRVVEVNDVGRLFGSGGYDPAQFTLIQRDVHNIDLTGIETNLLIIDKQDVGSVRLSGIVNSSEITKNGVGDVEAFGLQTQQSVVRLLDVGDIEVTAESSLDVTLNDYGYVYYKGNPAVSVSGDNRRVINSN